MHAKPGLRACFEATIYRPGSVILTVMLLAMTRRFSIRALLALLSIIALSLSWVTSNWRQSRIEQIAISEIQEKYSGFEVISRSTPLLCGMGVSGTADRNPTNPANRVLGNWWPETFDHVTSIYISGLRYDNSVMPILEKFPSLQSVSINRTSVGAAEIDDFRKSNPHVVLEVSEPTFRLTDKDDPRQILESINHW